MDYTAAATSQRAREAFRNQARFHAVCDQIVTEELRQHHPSSSPYELARAVAARVLQTVYENDAEIRYWKDLAERISQLSLEASYLQPSPLFQPKAE